MSTLPSCGATCSHEYGCAEEIHLQTSRRDLGKTNEVIVVCLFVCSFVGLFNNAIPNGWVVYYQVVRKTVKDVKGSSHVQHLAGGTEENHEKCKGR
jgi:hypothetical protein